MDKAKFSGEEVVETENFVFFWKPPAVFGQWTPSRFTVDGVEYVCAEQFMMAEKARVFGDEETLRRILATESPRRHKSLGRTVAGYDEAVWEERRFAIVVRGNCAKFTQNPEMERQLLATGEKTLAEASPYDKIWGIGLRADNPAALDPQKWRGPNLLGKALMEVRDKIRAGRR